MRPKKAIRRRKCVTDSDDEADGASSDYTPPLRKRAKVVPCRSVIKNSRKKAPARPVQLEDSDDDGAIVITVKKDRSDSGILALFWALLSVLFDFVSQLWPRRIRKNLPIVVSCPRWTKTL